MTTHERWFKFNKVDDDLSFTVGHPYKMLDQHPICYIHMKNDLGKRITMLHPNFSKSIELVECDKNGNEI